MDGNTTRKRRRRQVLVIDRCFFIDKEDHDIIQSMMKKSVYYKTRNIKKVAKIEDNYERRVCEVNWAGSLSSIGELDSLTHLKKLTISTISRPRQPPPSSIGRLTNLKELYLSFDGRLPDEICELVNLEVLVMRLGARTLPDGFGDLVGLKKLHLTGDYLRSLPSSFRQLHNLTELYLKMYRLTKSLPDEICYLTSLKGLNLACNSFITLPNGIEALVNLKKLDLRQSKITILPPSIGTLRSLTDLDGSQSSLEILPDEIGCLANLVRLDLTDARKFKSLPASIGRLHNLKELRLPTITRLPSEIGNLVRLKFLSLGVTGIKSFPSSFGRLQNLRELLIYSSRSNRLPDSIGNLTSLEKLKVDSGIKSLPPSFGRLQNLRELILPGKHNDKREEVEGVVQCNAIGNLERLTKLVLHGAKSLPPFGRLKNLRELELNYSYFTSLPDDIGEMVSLTKLDLCYTKINVLPASIGRLQNIKELYLASGGLGYYSRRKYYNAFLETLPSPVLRLQAIEKLSLVCRDDISSLPEKLATLKNLHQLKVAQMLANDRFSEGGSYFRFLLKLVKACRLLSTLFVSKGYKRLSLEEQRKISIVLANNLSRYKSFCLRKNSEFSSLKLWPFAIQTTSRDYSERSRARDRKNTYNLFVPVGIEQANDVYIFLRDNVDQLVGHFLSLREQGA